MKSLNTTDTIKLFKNVVDNLLARWPLRRISGYCDTCNKNKVEVGLQFYIRARREACLKCRAAEKLALK